jgi:S-DNA-T family DNA segregation ATPase FtsK/SpoIIIE
MLACALDPNTRLRVWELKGTGDLAAAKHVAHEYGSGANKETLEACLESVRAYHGQLDSRAKTLRDLAERSPELVPENKVTPEVCAQRSLGLFPDILIIDEVQEAFSDPDLGGQFESLLVPVTKRGPALGMSLILATQRPDAKSLPSGISANIGVRFCLKVMGWQSSNMVLGEGMSTAGFSAADFTRSDKGIGWLTGEADDPQIVRGCYIDAPKAERIALRARAARIAARTLSGYAAGHTDDADEQDVRGDVLAVFGTDPGLHWGVLAERLSEAFPDRWAATTAEALSAQCRGLGVPSVGVKIAGRNLQGCRRLDVEQVGSK